MVWLHPGGTITVIPVSISHGQGHETMYKILLSHRLGLDEAGIRVAHSDTDLAPDGGGTYAAHRSTRRERRDDRGRQDHRQGEEDRGAHAGGGRGRYRICRREFPRRRHRPGGLIAGGGGGRLCAVASAAGLETGLYDVASFAPEIPNFPNGCHVCEIEIDPETGKTEVLRYVVVDDVGTVINKLRLEGQIHGGVAPGHRPGPHRAARL